MKSNISPDWKIQVEFWQIKVKLVLLLYCFALANTIILHMLHGGSTMQFLQLKSCSQDLLACCFCRRNMRCNSCTVAQLRTFFLCKQLHSVLAMYTTTRIVLLVHIAICHTEHWVKAKVAQCSMSRLEFSILYLPHTFDSFYTLPHQKYRLSSFFPWNDPLEVGIKFFLTFTGNHAQN